MSDMREDEPSVRQIDFNRDTKGNHEFGAQIEVWTYSSLRNEKVYSPIVEVFFRADDMRDAHGFAQAISTTISHAHDVWQVTINKVWKRETPTTGD